jgi:hypothetical protein
MSEKDERHQNDEALREDEGPDVEGHIQDEFMREDGAADKGLQDEAQDRHRVEEAL